MQDGVQELRIDHGPGSRAYLSRQGPVVVLLLCGSDKSGQAKAIKQAVAFLNAWRKRGNPTIATVQKVLHAVGLRLSVTPA